MTEEATSVPLEGQSTLTNPIHRKLFVDPVGPPRMHQLVLKHTHKYTHARTHHSLKPAREKAADRKEAPRGGGQAAGTELRNLKLIVF